MLYKVENDYDFWIEKCDYLIGVIKTINDEKTSNEAARFAAEVEKWKAWDAKRWQISRTFFPKARYPLGHLIIKDYVDQARYLEKIKKILKVSQDRKAVIYLTEADFNVLGDRHNFTEIHRSKMTYTEII